jgi:PKD repeat protein
MPRTATATSTPTIRGLDLRKAVSASFTLDSSNEPTISVDASGSDGDAPLSFSWDFGDGTTGSGETTTHTYDAAGSYTVTLTVTDDGDTDQATQSVTIESVGLVTDYNLNNAALTETTLG